MAPQANKSAKPRPIFVLVVDGWGPFWMVVEAADNATLCDFDKLLRRTWLECCGHMSTFEMGGKGRSAMPLDDPWFDAHEEELMSRRLRDLLSKGQQLRYQYDFGSTTELRVRVVDDSQALIPSGAVRIIARNRPPAWKCADCGEPATQVCLECVEERFEDMLYCTACLGKHACGDEMSLPVTNSPRCGVCGYSGEQDKETWSNT